MSPPDATPSSGEAPGPVTPLRPVTPARPVRLEASQLGLGHLFYRTRDAIVVGEASSGHIVVWNDAAIELFGYDADEAIGLLIEDLVPESLKDKHRRGMARFAQGGHGRLIGASEPVELRALRKDGSEIWVELSLTPASAEGLPGRFAMAIIRNVTGRKALEAELHRSRAELERRAAELGLINELGNLLRSCATIDEAATVIRHMAPQIFPRESGALYLFGTSHRALTAACRWGDPAPAEVSFAPEDCWGLRRSRAHIVERPGGPRCAHVGSEATAALCVPMVAQGDTLGLFHLQTGSDEGAGSDGDSTPLALRGDLAVTVVEQLGLALSNLRLLTRLRYESIRDPLTSLYNRRYMDESLKREVRRASRNGLPLSVIAMDIDNFKDFNDNYGHGAGDLLLRKVADYLRDQIRSEDHACRQGGEEFLLIFPHATPEQAVERAEQLRLGVRSIAVVPHSEGSERSVTVSMGVAAYPDHGSNSADLLRAADQALYRAKARGRDCVRLAK